MEFTKKVKENWIAALESGKYIQGVEDLKCNGEHCCLGVLAEVTKGLSIKGLSVSYKGDEGACANDNYGILSTWFGAEKVEELWESNDKHCDGKYTAVIPLIKELETVD